ncbi:hypothetical protein B5E48_01890 [Massilimicrobiota sp. An105]|uniref:hypothetical protein n=1 Tax=Massilimicrobiota sp. An105 TaxID=1965540 RepID=UPI000B37ABB8|nr:hypothetical protein [Massilimicrobiota sp. An105]OUQ84175.1 hypothetical protein B5E48_01890 [Massilimicrobiota sp. An105]
MSNKLFMTAQEVADTLGMSKAYAYKLIQEMNQEMVKGGYVVLHGKINRSFLLNAKLNKKKNILVITLLYEQKMN